jgi:hypothetical protein
MKEKGKADEDCIAKTDCILQRQGEGSADITKDIYRKMDEASEAEPVEPLSLHKKPRI